MRLSELDLSAAAYGARWKREREMVRLRVEDGLSLSEVAERFDRSKELIRRAIAIYLYRTTDDYPRERRAALIRTVNEAARMQRRTRLAAGDNALGAEILAHDEGIDRDLVGIGAFVRASRRGAGMTQLDFAKAAGVARPTVSEFEKGVRALDLPTVRTIAHRLGLTTAELLRGEVPSLPPRRAVKEAKFSAMLRAARHKAGLSQRALCERSDICRSAVVAYETDMREPNLRPLIRLARGLGMTLPDLLDAAEQ